MTARMIPPPAPATKTLYLVRHAKSDWAEPGLADHDRPLAPRGLRAAPLMGQRLAQQGVHPDLILTSSAARARATAEILARELGYAPERIVVDPSLYACTPAHLLSTLQRLADSVHSVMLVGHNPEFSELANRLDPAITHMPTCAIASFTFHDEDGSTAWSSLGQLVPSAVNFDYPKKTG